MDLPEYYYCTASEAFLTEPLPEGFSHWPDGMFNTYLLDNKWQPLESMSPISLWGLIESHAMTIAESFPVPEESLWTPASRDDLHSIHRITQWRDEVYDDATRMSYVEWVGHRLVTNTHNCDSCHDDVTVDCHDCEQKQQAEAE